MIIIIISNASLSIVIVLKGALQLSMGEMLRCKVLSVVL
jgi:hypothetical protein